MNDYTKQLEIENEELRQRLAYSEKKALERDTAYNIINHLLKSGNVNVNYFDNKVSINVDSNITLSDVGEEEIKILLDIIEGSKERKKKFLQNLTYVDLFSTMSLKDAVSNYSYESVFQKIYIDNEAKTSKLVKTMIDLYSTTKD